MKKQYSTIIKYQGAKTKLLKHLLPKIETSTKNIFIEPFLGSGVTFINVHDKYDEYILNDIDSHIKSICLTIKNSTYLEFLDFYNNTIEKYGNLLNKINYYNFREYCNDHFEKSMKNLSSDNEILSGWMKILLYNSCINSFARWNKNKFNQSYGARFMLPSEKSWNIVKNKLNKSRIFSIDFMILYQDLQQDLIENSIMFLDPPYMSQPTHYASYKFNRLNFYKILENSKADILYTDILDDRSKLLNNFNNSIIRQSTINTSPFAKNQKTNKIEAMFYNF